MSISPGCQASCDRVLRHNGWSGWGGEGRPSPIPAAGKLTSGRRPAGVPRGPSLGQSLLWVISAQARSQGLRSFQGALELSPQRQLAWRLEAQNRLLWVPTRTWYSGLSKGATGTGVRSRSKATGRSGTSLQATQGLPGSRFTLKLEGSPPC